MFAICSLCGLSYPGARGLLTWLNIGKFVGGGIVGFLAIFILVVGDPIGLRLLSPRDGWTLSSAASGGDGAVVHAIRRALDMRVRCRGACDDIRLVHGAAASSPSLGGQRPGAIR